ncbi:MAG TPA: hypothetical protein VFG76_04290 [Candidatus Polarisedimenticolia bacterium]|nr:hypothetical protein [Candidatus Polarisedimenticolia bacterium]
MADARAEAPDVVERDTALAVITRAQEPVLMRWIEQDSDVAIKRVEAMVDILERVRRLSIRATYPTDWVIHVTKDADGNVVREMGYLQDCGAQRAAKPWGIEVSAPAVEREDFPQDGSYAYHMIAEAWCKMTGEKAEVSGSRWSGDRFFSAREDGPDGKVDPTDVRKAAYANLHGRAVRELAGLNAVPLDKLKDAGLDLDKLVRIGYAKGAKGGESTGATVGGNDVKMGFGNSRGKTPAELEDKDLAWYVKAYGENVADPEKKRFLKSNTAILEALKAEQARRAQAKAHEAETGTKAPDPDTKGPQGDVDGPKDETPTPRGKLMSETWTALGKACSGDQRLMMAVIKEVTLETFNVQKASLSDLTDEELRKLHGIIPAPAFETFVKIVKEKAEAK